MAEQPIGPVLDGLGVTVDLEDGSLVESALVVAKILAPDGSVVVGLYESTGMDWLGQLALVTAAQKIIDAPFTHHDED